MTDQLIYAALADVMADVDHVAKRDRNSQSGYAFRGVDAVVNAVGPVLRKHRVVVVPDLRSVEYETVQTSGGKPSTACRVIVAYTFTATDGSSLTTSVAAEAWDWGDKAAPKAMSVAYRIALLQALCLPTDEPDPDSQTYEREPSPMDIVLQHHRGDGPAAAAAAKALGFDVRNPSELASYARTLTGEAA